MFLWELSTTAGWKRDPRLLLWIFLHRAQALFCLSPGTISLCTPKCSAVPTTLGSFVFWQQNSMSSANLAVNRRSMWGEFAHGTGDEVVSAKVHGKPTGLKPFGTSNTHLKRPAEVELNTDLGFSGSNPGDRALFKRDHSKKDLKDSLRAWTVHFCDNPEAKGVSGCANAFLTNWKPFQGTRVERWGKICI